MVRKHHETPVDPDTLRDGDAVLYVAHLDNWHEDGGMHFLFELLSDGPPGPGRLRQGDQIRYSVDRLGLVEKRDEDGTLYTEKGYTLRAVGALAPWPGMARDEAGRMVLDVRHPNGVVTLHLQLRTLTHDPSGKAPHSWHRAGEVS